MYRPEILDEYDWNKAKPILDYDLWWNLRSHIFSLHDICKSAENLLIVAMQEGFHICGPISDAHMIPHMKQPKILELRDWEPISKELNAATWAEVLAYNAQIESLYRCINVKLNMIFPDHFKSCL